MSYKHGVYGNVVPTSSSAIVSTIGTIPVYVGTAPINMLNVLRAVDFNYAPYVNTPILITSYEDAVTKIGYSDNWADFTLCEAIYAHFKNTIQAIGPIIVINTFDPTTHATAVAAETVTMTAKVGYLNTDNVLLGTITLASGTITSAVIENGKTKITISETSATISVTRSKLDITKVVLADFNKGLAAIDLANVTLKVIPTVLAAPYFSTLPTFGAAMITKCASKISTKWGLICVLDIDPVSTTTTALTFKSTNLYNSKFAKVCYPLAKYLDKTFYLSTLAVVRMQQTDEINDGVPFESPSNKAIMCSGAVNSTGAAVLIDEVTANNLNANGITTISYIGGAFKLWGPHMGNYDYSNLASIPPDELSDSNIRMMIYLTNTLQANYIDVLDTPMSRRNVDSIKAEVQIWLNNLTNEGMLLYASIDFVPASNPTNELADGNFVFDVLPTTAPNGKSITFNVAYTSKGIDTLYGGVQ